MTMNTEENQPKPPVKHAKLYSILACILAFLIVIGLQVYQDMEAEEKMQEEAEEKMQEIERMKQAYFEKTYDEYCKYCKKEYLKERELYREYVDSVVAADSLERLTKQR